MLDIGAAGVLLVAVVLPAPRRTIRPVLHDPQLALHIAEGQADVIRDPADSGAAAQLADLLVSARQTDWALRVAGVAATTSAPERWRAAIAASAVHMDRMEVAPAYEWADKALKACVAPGADCPDFERTRLETVAAALKAVHDGGIDAKKNSKGVIDAAERAVPLIRLGKSKGS